MNELVINELARRQILAVSERVLITAEVAGILPTPLNAVAEATGITEIVDISDLPQELVAKKPSAWNEVKGHLCGSEAAGLAGPLHPGP